MAKKQTAKKATGKAKKTEKKSQGGQLVISPDQEKALKLVDKSAKVRDELEQAVGLAIAKVVRKVMKDHNISLTPPEASELTAIWFGE